MKKQCSKSGEKKLLDDFNSGKDEFGKHRWCKGCVKDYDRQRHQDQREKRIAQGKERTKELREWYRQVRSRFHCGTCGEDHPATLDFHHLGDDTKIDSVSVMVLRGFSKERIVKEILKCTVICSNCHRKEHYER